MVYVKDLIELDYFKKNHLTLAAGANGLKRIVTRPNIAQLMNFHEWMSGGEFLLVNGVGLHLDQVDQMLQLISNAEKGNAACIAFEMSETYIPKIPKEAVVLADRLKLPLFTLAWEVPFGEVLNTVYDYVIRKQMEETRIQELMQNILFADINTDYIIEQSAFYGIDLKKPHCVMIADCILEGDKGEVFTYIRKSFSVESNLGEKVMVMNHNGHIVAFLPKMEKQQIKNVLHRIAVQVKTAFSNVRTVFGIGKYYTDLFEYRDSYYEAVQAFNFLKLNHENEILFYEELGLVCLIDDSNQGEKIKNYVVSWLEPLMQEEHKVLLETFDQFQKDNFNISKASEHLFIHRNTLLQRLDKIYTLLQIDINDHNVRREIMNVMYLRHFINGHDIY